MFEKTNKSVLGINEYKFNRVRFLYKSGNSKRLLCFFSSSVKQNKEQQYYDVKHYQSRNESIIWFLDTPSGRGTYWLDQDFSYLTDIKKIIELLKEDGELFLLGSSKGAVGALFVLSLLDYENINILVHAPQFYIKSFLEYTNNQDVISNIEKIFGDDYNNIFHTLYNKQKLTQTIYISCGLEDGYHLRNEIPKLIQLLLEKKNNPIFIPLEGSHNNISVNQYQKLVDSYLEKTLSYEIYKQTNGHLMYLSKKDFINVLKENTIYGKSDIIEILNKYVKDNIKIFQYNGNKITFSLPILSNTLSAIYYRDKDGTKKIAEYTKKNFYEFTINGQIYEITLFLKYGEIIETIKFTNIEIKERMIDIYNNEEKGNISLIEIKNESRQIEAYISLINFINPIVPLPIMRGWAISPDFALVVINNILEKEINTIVELGSGLSTLIIGYTLKKLKKGKLISIEHSEFYANKTKKILKIHRLEEYVEVILSPLVEIELKNKMYSWYNLDNLNKSIKIDMLIVDGPPAGTNKYARYPALPMFINYMQKDSVIIMDDMIRKEEQDICNNWLKEFSEFEIENLETEKGASILRRKKS